MARMIHGAERKRGLSPGTPVYMGSQEAAPVSLAVLAFDREGVEELTLPWSAEALERAIRLRDGGKTLWVNLDGVHDVAAVKAVAEAFGVHPLATEDVCNPETRPKADDYDDHLFVALRMLVPPPDRRPEEPFRVVSEQLAVVLAKGVVLTFQERPADVLDPVRARLRTGVGRLRQSGPDYLAYAILDAVVDYYFVVLEHVGEAAEGLEQDILDGADQAVVEEVYELKRELVYLRKTIWPLREAVALLMREERSLFTARTRPFLRDLQDHVMHAAELVEAYRELTLGMLDLHLSMASNRMSEVMKVLTIVGTIFIPLTWIAGIYGMNFEVMPELRWRWGYPGVVAAQLAVGLGMLVWFRRRGWL